MLASCGHSPPVQFFTLTAIAPAHRAEAQDPTPIQVAAIHVPPALDRQEMVRESTATQVAVNDEHRWIAPFGDMVRHVLTEDLANRLPPNMVVYADEPPPARVNALVIDILRFVGEPDGRVVFDGSWSVVSGQGDTVIVSRHLNLSEPARSGDYRGQALAMSRLIGLLADSVVAGLSAR
jgi:uncharacterized protein